jgi:17beta-estradiol 17-dehydrogenase / very-long-chain 3-oxoacyl-CoA reductase
MYIKIFLRGPTVNNVGVMLPHPIFMEEISEQLIWNNILVNVGATTMMTSLVLPGMKQRKRGIIINLSSVLGVAPGPFLSVYSATKVCIPGISS